MALVWGAFVLVVFLLVQGPLVGAVLGAMIATGGAVIGLRIWHAFWISLTRRDR